MSARDVLADAMNMPRYWPDDVRFKRPDAYLAALSAAGFVVEQGWQPIETAPRDGNAPKFLALLPDGNQSLAWWDADKYARKPKPGWTTEIAWVMGKTWQCQNQPTHWRPLPTPPEPQP